MQVDRRRRSEVISSSSLSSRSKLRRFGAVRRSVTEAVAALMLKKSKVIEEKFLPVAFFPAAHKTELRVMDIFKKNVLALMFQIRFRRHVERKLKSKSMRTFEKFYRPAPSL